MPANRDTPLAPPTSTSLEPDPVVDERLDAIAQRIKNTMVSAICLSMLRLDP
jgi:hypothetical protein